jgi:hypothetical protein
MSYTEEDMCKQDVCKTFAEENKGGGYIHVT